MFASILAALTGFFTFFKELMSIFKAVTPSTSEKIDEDKAKIDEKLSESDKSGRP